LKPVLHFERSEFASRLAKVKQEMSRRGIDILLLSEPANQNYLTGWDAYSFYTPQMLIVALDHPEPIVVTRFMDRVSGRMTTWLADENIRGYPDQYVASRTLSEYDYVAGVVKEIGGESKTIGVETGGYYYSHRAHTDLTSSLPDAKFVDADLLVSWIRMVMSPAEVKVMHEAGRIAEAMIERAVQVTEPGVRECDLAGEIYKAQMSGTREYGGSYGCACLMLGIGERALVPHAAWTDDPIAPQTTVYIEAHGVRHRYQVNLSRTIVVGKASDDYLKFADIAVEALNAGLDGVRPGLTCEEVHATYAKALKRQGYEKEGRLGYPVGIGFPPALQFRTASIRPGDKTVLQPGMAFHMMAALWLDQEKKAVSITQSFVVTDNGHEPLTTMPRKLFFK
jgi:Xaa-Pro aminopeptidase